MSFNQKALSVFKKLGAVALITATLAMCFTACKQTGGGNSGTGGGGGKPTPTPTPKPKHVITFGVEGTPANGELFAKADGIAKTRTSPISVEEGKEVTFIISCGNGYMVKEWKVDGTVISNKMDIYIHTVTKPATITVSFKEIPPTKHKVTLNQTANGTVTASPEIPEDGQVVENTEITFTAKADSDYKIGSWSVSPSSAIQSGGNKGDATAKVKITAETSVSVNFELVPEGKAILTLDPTKLKITVTAKTADGKPIVVEGCTVTTLASNRSTELQATGTTVTLKGKITELFCYWNQLTALDVQDLTSLQTLSCSQNQLGTLVLQGLTSLQKLYCHTNKLTELNVQDCTALQELNCYNNLLTAFDVHGLTALHTLGCYNNQLKSLNVSGCTALRTLTCYANQINAQSMTELLKALPASEADDDAVALLYTEKTKTGVTEDNCKDFGQPAELKTAFDGAKGRNWTLKKINKSGKWEEI